MGNIGDDLKHLFNLGLAERRLSQAKKRKEASHNELLVARAANSEEVKKNKLLTAAFNQMIAVREEITSKPALATRVANTFLGLPQHPPIPIDDLPRLEELNLATSAKVVFEPTPGGNIVVNAPELDIESPLTYIYELTNLSEFWKRFDGIE